MPGERLGQFELLDKLGEGGMGIVYKARDTRLDRLVAIKLLPESLASGSSRRSRFIQEAKAASALNHPNIIAIYDIAEDAGRTYIVMEYVNRKTLDTLIPTKACRSPKRSALPRKWPPRWHQRTQLTSPIATSSPPISWWTPRSAPACSTSA